MEPDQVVVVPAHLVKVIERFLVQRRPLAAHRVVGNRHGGAHITAGQPVIDIAKDGNVIWRDGGLVVGLLVLAVVRKAPEQRLEQVGPALQHGVVDRVHAGRQAQATTFGGINAEQAHVVALVRMQWQFTPAGVAARGL